MSTFVAGRATFPGLSEGGEGKKIGQGVVEQNDRIKHQGEHLKYTTGQKQAICRGGLQWKLGETARQSAQGKQKALRSGEKEKHRVLVHDCADGRNFNNWAGLVLQ